MGEVIKLDLKGLSCPMPILKTKQALKNAENGTVFHILTTDPHSEIDFKSYILRTNHTLIECREESGTFTIIIEKTD